MKGREHLLRKSVTDKAIKKEMQKHKINMSGEKHKPKPKVEEIESQEIVDAKSKNIVLSKHISPTNNNKQTKRKGFDNNQLLLSK